MNKIILSLIVLGTAASALAEDLLIKVASPVSASGAAATLSSKGLKTEVISDSWIHIRGNTRNAEIRHFLKSGAVSFVQPNFKFKTLENPSLAKARQNATIRKILENAAAETPAAPSRDNPAIPNAPANTSGNDPLFSKQWGMKDIGVEAAWNISRGDNKIIVAVIDTGVDYTHEDLLPNLWRNSKEIADNGKDDDNNGYIDDIVGWDYIGNDNKPYDLAATSIGELLNGGNPGHGTHCAGNVAAAGQNSKGISGIAPHAQIMALRFIGDQGGTTSDAVKAIKYAVDNGAKILSNSWGSEGDDPADQTGNQALKDAIKYAEDNGVLFIAAAGNGHQGVGYNNDSDPKPAVPASYDHENIISVAAIDSSNNLGSFSNWGEKTVDIAAPGVKVFSTTVGNKYADTLIDILGVNWDGTSMACPHVAGAAALFWSLHPDKSWQDVKAALINSAKKTPSLEGKILSNGRLNVENLMKQ